MEEQSITFHRYLYDPDDTYESYWHVEVQATNGSFSGTLDFYTPLESLNDWGSRLVSFGGNLKDEVRFEVGSREGNWAYYLLIHAFIYDRAGHAAIEFTADNRATPPYGAEVRFSFQSEVAAINRFGRQLRHWTKSSDEPLIWTPNFG